MFKITNSDKMVYQKLALLRNNEIVVSSPGRIALLTVRLVLFHGFTTNMLI